MKRRNWDICLSTDEKYPCNDGWFRIKAEGDDEALKFVNKRENEQLPLLLYKPNSGFKLAGMGVKAPPSTRTKAKPTTG